MQARLLRQEVRLWNLSLQMRTQVQVLRRQETLHRMQDGLLRQEVRLWHLRLQVWPQGQVLRRQEVRVLLQPPPYNRLRFKQLKLQTSLLIPSLFPCLL
jgi:hypothetical protein